MASDLPDERYRRVAEAIDAFQIKESEPIDWCAHNNEQQEFLIACAEGREDDAALLMPKDNMYKWLGLQRACVSGHLAIVKLLVRNGTRHIDEGIRCAAVHKRLRVLEYLLQLDPTHAHKVYRMRKKWSVKVDMVFFQCGRIPVGPGISHDNLVRLWHLQHQRPELEINFFYVEERIHEYCRWRGEAKAWMHALCTCMPTDVIQLVLEHV